MIRIIYSLAVCALAACLGIAQTPSDAKPGILLLEDFQVLEGTVEPMRDARNPDAPVKQYRVTAGGRATMVSATQVLTTGVTRKDAYEYLKKRKKTAAHEDRVWLALWCQKNSLVLEGREEARAALALAPDDKYVQNLLKELETAKATLTDDTIRIVRPKVTPAVVAPKPGIPVDQLAIQANVTATQEKLFPKVGVILQNQCLKCHDSAKMKTGFVLERVPEGTTTGAAWKANIATAAKYARSTDPTVSPLVKYATTPHGGQYEASLALNHPAAKNLAAWAETFPAPEAPQKHNVVLQTQPAPIPPPATTPTPSPAPTMPIVQNAQPTPAPAPITTPMPPLTPEDPNAPKKVKIELGPGTTDPFDPSEFNKQNKGKSP